ncbi:MAG: class I SAM-dependent methyltransferase [Prochlorotrichaceae cyanobacterium]|jgi:caffeoyl-CoA O-methyltransferase
MTIETLSLTPDLYQYLHRIALREPVILQQLRQETATHPMGQMQIAPEQGQFMAFLVKLMEAKKILEIGVFTGYSSLSMALALPPEGTLIACDRDREATAIAQRYWQAAGVEARIQLYLAPALETLQTLLAQGEAASFDLVFIDADKRNYDRYYELSLELLRQGGLILIDNVLWGGKVADPHVRDPRTEAIRAFNAKLVQDDRIDLSVLPVADGLTLARKR